MTGKAPWELAVDKVGKRISSYVRIIGLLLGFLSGFPLTHAALPTVGRVIDPVVVSQGGEIILSQHRTVFQRWQLDSTDSQAELVIHVAGRLTAKHQLAGLITQLATLTIDRRHIRFITIVNTDDTLFGSAFFVERSLIITKKESPQDSFIVDRSGVVAHRWQLQPGSAAIVLLDRQQKVVFFHQGALTQALEQQIIYNISQFTAKS